MIDRIIDIILEILVSVHYIRLEYQILMYRLCHNTQVIYQYGKKNTNTYNW